MIDKFTDACSWCTCWKKNSGWTSIKHDVNIQLNWETFCIFSQWHQKLRKYWWLTWVKKMNHFEKFMLNMYLSIINRLKCQLNAKSFKFYKIFEKKTKNLWKQHDVHIYLVIGWWICFFFRYAKNVCPLIFFHFSHIISQLKIWFFFVNLF